MLSSARKTALTIPPITIPCKVIAYLKESFHSNPTFLHLMLNILLMVKGEGILGLSNMDYFLLMQHKIFFLSLQLMIPEAYLPDPQKQIFHKRAEILILCRCQDHAHAFPINRDGQPRFIAVREKLYREENIVHQARTPFNSRLMDKEENERQQRLVKTVFAGDQIRRGFENDLKSPID